MHSPGHNPGVFNHSQGHDSRDLDLNTIAEKIAHNKTLTREERLVALYNPQICKQEYVSKMGHPSHSRASTSLPPHVGSGFVDAHPSPRFAAHHSPMHIPPALGRPEHHIPNYDRELKFHTERAGGHAMSPRPPPPKAKTSFHEGTVPPHLRPSTQIPHPASPRPHSPMAPHVSWAPGGPAYPHSPSTAMGHSPSHSPSHFEGPYAGPAHPHPASPGYPSHGAPHGAGYTGGPMSPSYGGPPQGDTSRGLLGSLAGAFMGPAPPQSPGPAPAQGQGHGQQGHPQGQGQAAILADVYMLSGCMDAQTSADVSNTASLGASTAGQPGRAGGACTTSLLGVVAGGKPSTWIDALKGMRTILKQRGYKQLPQLSTSRQIDLRQPYSVCRGPGRKRACLVGINYRGQKAELKGCINDVLSMRDYVQSQGYSDVRILTEDVALKPTKDNILNEGMGWLVAGAQPGDNLFFHFSGHGAQVRDQSGDEADRLDETIVPLDFQQAGQIVDDLILQRLVLPLPQDCNLTVVMDCCHSGTVLDLPYTFVADGANVTQPQPATHPNGNFKPGKLAQAAGQLFNAFFR